MRYLKKIKEIIFLLFVTSVVIFVVFYYSFIYPAIEQGSFIILAFTLLCIIWYTFFTYGLLKKRDQVGITCTLEHIKGTQDIRVLISNLSKEVLRVYVDIKIISNEKVFRLNSVYSGETPWTLTPFLSINGHFMMSDPLKTTGFSLDDLKNKVNNENRTKLYRIVLQTKWKDNYENIEKYPPLHWHFDFMRDELVYEVN